MKTKRFGFLGLAVLVAAFSAAALTVRVPLAEAATLTVNTTDDADDGACTTSHCSLREAINAANRFSDTDTIAFAIPGPAPHTIRWVSGGPWRLFFPVIIDGTTEPGYAGTPIIELDGSLSTPAQDGLGFFQSSGGSTVRGLVINRFKGRGIALQSTGNYRIENNYIGTDLTGTLARGNGDAGIMVQAHPFADNGRNTIVRNVISANGLTGIVIAGDEDENVVQGNFIGTNAAGTAALGNGREGLIIVNGPNNGNLIGGSAAGARNVISGNGDSGIEIGGACNPCEFVGNVVQGNYIGTNASGTAALGNRGSGIIDLGSDTTIGGTVPGARNIISANGLDGILIFGPSTGGVVQGNLIGTGADGTSPLGNGGVGVHAARSTGRAIGGIAPGAGNTIAYNGGDGVKVGMGSSFTFCCGNGILSNSIFSNGGLGIDLNPPGVTPNDPGDVDRGPNELQNFPILTAVTNTAINGTLNSKPSTSYRLEFFANRERDASGFGEGERFLGSIGVTTDSTGNAAFSFAPPGGVPAGQFITATATDPVNNTSEFSGAVQAPAGEGTGTIVIVKNANPESSKDFSFNGSGAIGSFLLDDDQDPTLPDRRTFSGLSAGGYTVTEAVPAGWKLTHLVCQDPDGGSRTSLGTATATIDLDAGETVTCTFNNQHMQ
jgi:CSLREA domain-containing protein